MFYFLLHRNTWRTEICFGEDQIIYELSIQRLKCLVFVEWVNKHKMLVKQLPGHQDCPTLFKNTDFTVPLLYDFPITNYLASFSGDNLFLSLHFARLVVVEHFGACGYKCFSDYLGLCLFYTFILLNFIKYFCVCHFQDSHG